MPNHPLRHLFSSAGAPFDPDTKQDLDRAVWVRLYAGILLPGIIEEEAGNDQIEFTTIASRAIFLAEALVDELERQGK